MALFFRNYLGKFALMATSVLWASCSDADKNADKSPEQEHAKIEYPEDSKKAVDDKSSVTSHEKQKFHDNVYDPGTPFKDGFDFDGYAVKFKVSDQDTLTVTEITRNK